MKNLPFLMLMTVCMGAAISCTKTDTNDFVDVSMASASKKMSFKEIVEPSPRLDGYIQPTDEELVSMGKGFGCVLAKRAGTFLTICQDRIVNGVVQYNPNTGLPYQDCTNVAEYEVYLNTVNNLTFPEVYRDAVRLGFQECYSLGDPATNSITCNTVTTLERAYMGGNSLYVDYKTKTICQAQSSPIYQ